MLDLYGYNTGKIIGGGACLIGLLLGIRDGEAAVVAACCAALASVFADDLKRLVVKASR